MRKQKIVATQRLISVAISVPPGNYNDKNLKSAKLSVAVSSDMCELMNECRSPVPFYLAVKEYLQERDGLYKMFAGDDIIESSIHATKVSLMAMLVHVSMVADEDDNDDYEEARQYRKHLRGALNEVDGALESRSKMEKFDAYCNRHFTVEKADSTEAAINIDSHLNAES